MNIVAQEVIDKLKLPIEKHPKPYIVAWVNDHSIPVTRRCLITFQIGVYEDEIWYDIIPMNIAHILLVPWLFDRKLITDQKKHMHSFKWKGQMVDLLPMPLIALSPPTPTTSSNPHVLTMRKFEEETKEQNVMFALVTKQVQEPLKIRIHTKAQALLHEYSDLTPEELPKELPPM